MLAAASALGAVALVVIAALTIRGDRAETTKTLKDVLVHHPARRVSVVEPTDVGVARAEVGGGVPSYVDREIDAELREALSREHAFVVLRGRSKEGKSRTAFEAIAALPSDPYLLAVRSGQSVDEVVTLRPWLETHGPVVLWLDRIDRFLRGGQLTRATLVQFFEQAPESKVFGTIEAGTWAEILQASEEDDYEPAAVLQEARAFLLRPTSDGERRRAREMFEGESFDLGIGQHFIGARELQERYDGADPDACAIVRAAVDWQRTGMPRGANADELEALHRTYLDGPRGHGFGDALKWCVQRVTSGGQLLEREGDEHYRAPDHLVEYVVDTKRAATIRPEAWTRAIGGSKAREAIAIGGRALELHANEVALTAFERAYRRTRKMPRTHAEATYRSAVALGRLKRFDEALARFGELEEPNTSWANNFGYMLMRNGHLDAAAAIFADAVKRGNRTAAFNLLETLARAGRLEHAEPLLQAGSEAGNPGAALLLGTVLHARGDLDGAERLYRAAQEESKRVDASIARRARILSALTAEARGDRATADTLFRENWSSDDWKLIEERLRHLRVDLSGVRDVVARRTSVTIA